MDIFVGALVSREERSILMSWLIVHVRSIKSSYFVSKSSACFCKITNDCSKDKIFDFGEMHQDREKDNNSTTKIRFFFIINFHYKTTP
jgi:hypothetical protein